MKPTAARLILLTTAAASLCALPGCKGGWAQASGSAADLSGPATYNEVYQARNPRTCSRLTSPPNAAQAAALVQCSSESDTTGSSTPLITLVTDLKVEVGAPRDFIFGPDNMSDIDTRASVYPIRGTGTMWQCSPVPQYPAGQNCVSYPPTAPRQGTCYKTTFGDWTCRMPSGGPRQVQKQKGPTTY